MTEVQSAMFFRIGKVEHVFVKGRTKTKLSFDNLSFGKFTQERTYGNKNGQIATSKDVEITFYHYQTVANNCP